MMLEADWKLGKPNELEGIQHWSSKQHLLVLAMLGYLHFNISEYATINKYHEIKPCTNKAV